MSEVFVLTDKGIDYKNKLEHPFPRTGRRFGEEEGAEEWLLLHYIDTGLNTAESLINYEATRYNESKKNLELAELPYYMSPTVIRKYLRRLYEGGYIDIIS